MNSDGGGGGRGRPAWGVRGGAWPRRGRGGDEQCPRGRAGQGPGRGSTRAVGKGNSLPENAGVGSARALRNGRRRLPVSRRCPCKTLPAPFYANALVRVFKKIKLKKVFKKKPPLPGCYCSPYRLYSW
jgi:hypothetical protein